MTNERRWENLYRKVFQTDEGQQVLTDILNDCGFYGLDDLKSSADIARLNVGRRILGKCGIWEPSLVYDLTDTLVRERSPKGWLQRVFKLRKETKELDNLLGDV